MRKLVNFSKNDQKTFLAHHIMNADEISYSDVNLVIGENGAGKTRFLKAIEDLKTQRSKDDPVTVTLYFPEISPHIFEHTIVDNDVDLEQEKNPYVFDLLHGNIDINYCDFLKVVEQAEDRCNFIKGFFGLAKIKAPAERKKAYAALDKFNKIFQELVNRRFEEDKNEIIVNKYFNNEVVHTCTLEDAFMATEISPGELMLFYFTLFLFFIETTSNKKLVVIIDEPEQHLHPQKQIFLMNLLLESESISEVWVATHSLFLVPLFDFESIVLVENSRVLRRNSSIYKNAFNCLVGLENIDVFEFLKSIESWQFYKFILECFYSPDVIEHTNSNNEQFVRTITKLRDIQKDRPLEVLDFGAGKCRIWDSFKSEYENSNGNLQLNYFAYEPKPDRKYQYDSKIMLVTEESKLTKYYGKFDVVILMNVLHEIPLEDWENTFKLIRNLLNVNGVLIFLEVKNLSRGEQPYGNNGFLVLGDKQVEILFDEVGIGSFDDEEKSNLWTIDKDSLTRISNKRIVSCIESLKLSAEKTLKIEFDNRINAAHSKSKFSPDITARKYAYLSQLYLNCKFALEMFTSDSPSEDLLSESSSFVNVLPPPI